MDWYWRMRMGFPPRSEDREALRRIAPELFGRDWEITVEPTSDQHPIWGRPFQREIRLWLGTLDDRPTVTVHEGACPQYDCPLRLGRRSGQIMGGQTSGDDAHPGGEVVLELMTVAGGWSAKAKTFFDMARKVHGGKGPVKNLLVTDPYIYSDKSEENTTGGIDNFLQYLDCLDISQSEIAIYQPPYAKGKKGTSGALWRRAVEQHGKTQGYGVRFGFFRTITETRFHDRFYLARHRDGSVSGLFGPSMNGLNDKSFVLVGELEELTLKRLRHCLDGWA
ncbi:hypothetical protein [Bradyrhizobium canariense]|uniref:Uncharacterized protein n=1 Tax=Bradyrhizobium canariense TaxID=255045 RepID=A0A1H1YIU7_9BRAD|nr:hypothetical protein [Bradyrhizobium canariense]SDT21343.1 hypothetical protein SAMN05444158_4837 [Bradyrhizobium canariense]